MPAGTKQEPIENVAKLTPKDLAPSQLDFDATNPRLGGDRKRLTQAHIQKILEGEEHLALELVPSLVANGFIPYEPLIVRKVGSRYVVLEGNRRLAAVKHILAKKDQYPAEVVKDLTKIPTLTFKDEGGDQERRIRTYLGVRHLFGFREWPPESKAHFLDQNISSAQDLARIMKEMNLSKGEVMRYLMPVRIMRAAGDVLANFEGKDFWVLGEALGRSDIREYIKLVYDPNTFDVKSFDLDKFNYLLEFLYGNEEEVRPGEYSAIRNASYYRYAAAFATREGPQIQERCRNPRTGCHPTRSCYARHIPGGGIGRPARRTPYSSPAAYFYAAFKTRR